MTYSIQNCWYNKIGIGIFVGILAILSSFASMAQEPAWWTQQKKDCGLSPSLAYNTWVAQGSPCNKSGSGTSGGMSRAQAHEIRVENRHIKAVKLNDQGVELEKAGKHKEAVKYYQKALKLYKDDQTILNNLKNGISRISDDEIYKEKTSDNSWHKSLRKPHQFHEWADIWTDKENKETMDRSRVSKQLEVEADKLSGQGDFKEAHQKLEEALDIDPDNGIVIQENIKKLTNAEVSSLNNDMLTLSATDYEAALMKARAATLADPNNPLTKENLNKIEVNALIQQAHDAYNMESNDMALEKLSSALEKDPGNDSIKGLIKNVQVEINRVKYEGKQRPAGIGVLDGTAIKDLTSIARDTALLDKASQNGYDNQRRPGDAITVGKPKEIPMPLEELPAYKNAVAEIVVVQKKYKDKVAELESIHNKMKDPVTKPEELKQLSEQATSKKKEIENTKKEFDEKKQVREEIKKSYHIDPIGDDKEPVKDPKSNSATKN